MSENIRKIKGGLYRLLLITSLNQTQKSWLKSNSKAAFKKSHSCKKERYKTPKP